LDLLSVNKDLVQASPILKIGAGWFCHLFSVYPVQPVDGSYFALVEYCSYGYYERPSIAFALGKVVTTCIDALQADFRKQIIL
jgi:hypothetical protein